MELGEKVMARISGQDSKYSGIVTYIHPQGRFYMVTFALGLGQTLRECYPILPPSEPWEPQTMSPRFGFHRKEEGALS